jgi:hypothetical protein
MDKPLNRIVVLLMQTTLLAVALSAVFALLCGVGRDSVAAYIHAIRERERLEEDRTIIFGRNEGRRNIFAGLIEGRLSLREAANALNEDEHRPEHLRLPAFLHWLPLTKKERYMHLLLILAENRLQSDPRRDEVLKRLRAEFQAYQDARPRSPSDDPPGPRGGPTTPPTPAPVVHPTFPGLIPRGTIPSPPHQPLRRLLTCRAACSP